MMWQREKRLLFSTSIEQRGRHLPVKPVKCTRTQAPARTRPIQGDGNCLFRCLSYAVWRTEQQHELIRAYIVKHYSSVWEHPRVQRSSRLWFLKETKQENVVTHIPSFPLSIAEYLSVSKMDEMLMYGGSTELETAANFFQTPIRVY